MRRSDRRGPEGALAPDGPRRSAGNPSIQAAGAGVNLGAARLYEEDETMKVIYTKVRNGVVRAHDGDGNRAQVQSYHLSTTFEKAHAEAVRALCEKMDWHGRLIGGHALTGGRNTGMVWVFDDERSPKVLI